MSSSGEEDDTGPSLDATDPEERIAFRRIRIQKRLDAQRRAQLGEDMDAQTNVAAELSRSRRQMEESRLRMRKLREDGDELVTNIRDATDAREGAWRREEDEVKRQRRERLSGEDKAGSDRFDEITRRWENALQKEIPQDLYEMLMQQKSSCNAMLDEKNKLINDFQMELKVRDDHYVKELKKESEAIDLMTDRMDEQVTQLATAGQAELSQIEKAFVAQRVELMDAQADGWQERADARSERELEYLRAREKRVSEHERQLAHMRLADGEEYNMVKIKYETDIQIMQQQSQLMKATYQLNQEKLEYNFQVLRKRDEENTITKSQQKRKITRMQDVLTHLKAKLAKQEKQFHDDNQQLSDDYRRITQQFKDLQRKSKHFMVTDQKKFREIWLMNEGECKRLVGRLLNEDRVIHEQQLGLPWGTPNLEFMVTSGPIISEKQAKTVPARKILQEVLSADHLHDDVTTNLVTLSVSGSNVGTARLSATSRKEATPRRRYSPRAVKQILELLGDESGFLIESKLNTLLQHLSETKDGGGADAKTKDGEDEKSRREKKKDQCLMRLDAIFTALGVETEEDIYLIASYFLKSAEETPSEVGRDDGEAAEEGGEGSVMREDVLSTRSCRSSVKVLDQTLIHPNEVLKALRAFVEDHREPPKLASRPVHFQLASSDERDDSDDSAHWLKFPAVLSTGTEKVWQALIEAMDKYSALVIQRSTLITDTESLQTQNSELRMLLHQYVNSRVNKELEIPPTRVLQLELNPPQLH